MAVQVFEHLQDRCLSSGLRDDTWVLSLTAAQQAVYALGALDRAVQGDGWQGYFWNASGDTFPEAKQGARLLAAKGWSILFHDAGEALQGGYSQDIDVRQKVLETMEDEEQERRFRPLDHRLYALDFDPATSLNQLLGALIERHAKEFFIEP